MAECVDFYSQRDLRTSEYLRNQPWIPLQVHVAIDLQAASGAAGQLALLALANQLVRAHRRVTFDLPSSAIPLLVRIPFSQGTLAATLLSMVGAIDPCGEFRLGKRPAEQGIAIGLGENAPERCDWYIGANDAVGLINRSPVPFLGGAVALRGAALSSCLGAAAVFRSSVGLETVERRVSSWDYSEGAGASRGRNSTAPLDVGRVLMVGAGAVAASLAYWLHAFGAGGRWSVVDRDLVEVHNLNRGLVFTAANAGWPLGNPARKAEIVASLLASSRWDPNWYDQSSLVNEHYDVVLGLANDRDVRHFIASRNNTVTLQATTGENWLSQLHRHIAGVDDCIWCRAGEVGATSFACSAGLVESPTGARTDAALPFLSAASGLMLATALERLQTGDLALDECNDWRWDFGSTYRMSSSGFRQCQTTCTRTLPLKVRRQLDKNSRWIALGQ